MAGGDRAQRVTVPTPPLPEWLRTSIDAFPSPVAEQMLGYATTAWDEGFQLGVVECRKRRRGTSAEQARPAAAGEQVSGD